MSNKAKELSADVAIIGGGACGLAAALTVASSNRSAIVLEKAAEFGGMTNWCEGMFAVGTRYQKQMKLPYTVEDRFKVHMEAASWSADARIVRAFMEKTADTVDWLESMGCEFGGVVSHYPGAPFVWHVFKHTPGVTVAPGHELIEKMLKKVNEQKQISLLPETSCKSILREGGKITGVTAEDKDGNPVRIKSKAVVCATGGYADNRDWVDKYCKAGRSIKSWDDQHQTGDAIKMAWEAGAAPDGLGVMQAFTFPSGEMVNTQLFGVGCQANLWVNERGERFTDESNIMRFPLITNAISRQPNARAYNIFDQDIVTFLKEKGMMTSIGEYLPAGSRLTDIDAELERGIKEGKVFAAATIEELAHMLNIKPGTLVETVREYNACCDSNYDFVMAKERQYLHAIRKPLFFAIKLGVVIGITEGGIKINHKMEVIDNDFNVIPGLYAGGCAAGGVVGDAYQIVTTGASDSFAVNSGRIAGESILKYLGQ
jgi:fumarate reductase flavoprotein subunit